LSLGKLVSIEILTKKPSASIGGGSSLVISMVAGRSSFECLFF